MIPAIEALRARFDVPLSVDTWRAIVAKEAYAAGAVVGNDISGFADPDYLAVAAAAGATVVATHIRLGPRIPDPDPVYDDVVGVRAASSCSSGPTWATAAGLPPDRIVLDAGLDLGQDGGPVPDPAAGVGPAGRARVPAAPVGVEQDLPRCGPRSRIGQRREASLAATALGAARAAGSCGSTTWPPTGRCATPGRHPPHPPGEPGAGAAGGVGAVSPTSATAATDAAVVPVYLVQGRRPVAGGPGRPRPGRPPGRRVATLAGGRGVRRTGCRASSTWARSSMPAPHRRSWSSAGWWWYARPAS